MHLGGAVLIALALVAAETSADVEPRSWLVRVGMIAVGCLVVVIAAAAIAGLVAGEIRNNPGAVRSSLRGYSRLRRVHTGIWFIISWTAVLVVQWPQWIELELHRFIVIDELLILLPLVLPMYFSHAAFFEVDRAAAFALDGDSAPRASRDRWSYAWWFARHEFGLVLLPLLILFLVRDVAKASGWSAGSAEFWPIAALSLAAILIGLPLLVRHVWPCEPLPHGELRRAIAEECRLLAQPAPRLFKWHTGGRVVNALVTGTLPRTQCVLLSDALLDHFSCNEILAVVRHELAHARRHHVLLRVAAMAAPLAVCYAAGVHVATLDAYERLAAMRPAAGEVAALTALGLGLAAYARWVFGRFSQLLEIEADLMGCREHSQTDSAQAALYKLGCVYGFERQSWLHPTIRTRLRILRAARRRAALRARLVARANRWKRAILLALAAAALACAF